MVIHYGQRNAVGAHPDGGFRMTSKVEQAKADARSRTAREKAERDRVERIREEKREAATIDTTELDTRTVNVVANYGDPDKDPRVGEQNVPPEERIDGYTDGVRHDQMEGVQSAAQREELDQDQLIDENLKNPPNRAALEDRQYVEREEVRADGYVSPKTQEEMNAGKKAIGHYGKRTESEMTRAQAKDTEARQKAAHATPQVRT